MNGCANFDVETVLKRRALDGLAVFCAAQRYHFDPAAWMRRSVYDGRRVALAAQYLAMTGWYGHEAELEAIAEKINPGLANIDTFMQEMQATDIKLGWLSSAIRFGLAPSGQPNPPAGSQYSAAA